MPFKVTDLMIDVLPGAEAAEGMLAVAEGDGDDDKMQCPTLMTQGQTAECEDDQGEDEEEDLCPNMSNVQQTAACTGVSQAEEGYPRRAEERRMADLGALRRQLRDTLTIQPAG